MASTNIGQLQNVIDESILNVHLSCHFPISDLKDGRNLLTYWAERKIMDLSAPQLIIIKLSCVWRNLTAVMDEEWSSNVCWNAYSWFTSKTWINLSRLADARYFCPEIIFISMFSFQTMYSKVQSGRWLGRKLTGARMRILETKNFGVVSFNLTNFIHELQIVDVYIPRPVSGC